MQRLHHLTFLVRVLGKKQSIGVFLSNKGNSIVFACFLGVIVIYLFSRGYGRVCKTDFFSSGIKQME